MSADFILRGGTQRKITYEDACSIRALHANRVQSTVELSDSYGISTTQVLKIIRRESYTQPVYAVTQQGQHLPYASARPAYHPSYYTPSDGDVHAQVEQQVIRTSYDHSTHPEYIAQAADARRRWREAGR